MSKYPNKVKCASIYMNGSLESSSNFSGSSAGLGIGLAGGLGIFGGSVSGNQNTTTRSKISELFREVNEEVISNESWVSSRECALSVLGVITLFLFGSALLLSPEKLISFICNTDISSCKSHLSFLGLFFMLCSALKFCTILIKGATSTTEVLNTEDTDRIKKNYERVWYDPTSHVIFIDEDIVFSANRENFERLVRKTE